ncbi:hypothetical protein ACX841_07595 [Burkholderia pseudomallei]
MVLANPCRFEPAALGELHEFGHLVEQVAMRRLRVVSLHMQEQRKLHDGSSPIAGSTVTSLPQRTIRRASIALD